MAITDTLAKNSAPRELVPRGEGAATFHAFADGERAGPYAAAFHCPYTVPRTDGADRAQRVFDSSEGLMV